MSALHPTDGSDNQRIAIRAKVIPVSGAELYCEIAGKGPHVVFLQRDLIDHRIWDHQFTSFARQYTVVRYDPRGLGKSSNSTEAYSQTSDLYNLLQALGVEKACLVNIGENIALDFIHEYPDYVTALVLVSQTVRTYQSVSEAMADLPRILEHYTPIIQAIRQQNLSQAADYVLQELVVPSLLSPEEEEHLKEIIVANLPRFLQSYRPPTPNLKAFTDRQQWLKEIHVPTLILEGTQASSEVRSSSELLIKNVADAQKYVLEQARFLLNVEQPETFNHALYNFLQQIF